MIADLRSDQRLTVTLRGDSVTASDVNTYLKPLGTAAREELAAEKFDGTPHVTSKFAMRYLGQNYEHEITILGDQVTDDSLTVAFRRFEALHDEFYGYHLEGEVIEIVTLSVTAVGLTTLSQLPPSFTGRFAGHHSARSVYFRNFGLVEASVVHRESLPFGATLEGPTIVEDSNSTTLLFPGDCLTVLNSGVLSIRIVNERGNEK